MKVFSDLIVHIGCDVLHFFRVQLVFFSVSCYCCFRLSLFLFCVPLLIAFILHWSTNVNSFFKFPNKKKTQNLRLFFLMLYQYFKNVFQLTDAMCFGLFSAKSIGLPQCFFPMPLFQKCFSTHRFASDARCNYPAKIC